jgi:hypothetical protein
LPKYTKRLQIESDCDDGSGEVELVELRGGGGGLDDEAAGFLGYYDAAADRVGGEELEVGPAQPRYCNANARVLIATTLLTCATQLPASSRCKG